MVQNADVNFLLEKSLPPFHDFLHCSKDMKNLTGKNETISYSSLFIEAGKFRGEASLGGSFTCNCKGEGWKEKKKRNFK